MGTVIRLNVLAKNGDEDSSFSVWTMVLSTLPLLVPIPLSPARYEFSLRTLSSMTTYLTCKEA